MDVFEDTMDILKHENNHPTVKHGCWDFDKKEELSWTETFGIPFYSKHTQHEVSDSCVNRKCFYFATFLVIAFCGIGLLASYLAINLSK